MQQEDLEKAVAELESWPAWCANTAEGMAHDARAVARKIHERSFDDAIFHLARLFAYAMVLKKELPYVEGVWSHLPATEATVNRIDKKNEDILGEEISRIMRETSAENRQRIARIRSATANLDPRDEEGRTSKE